MEWLANSLDRVLETVCTERVYGTKHKQRGWNSPFNSEDFCQMGEKSFVNQTFLRPIVTVMKVQETLTCSQDSLEAVWDGFPASSNHKSHCFPPPDMESGPEWQSPTWWPRTTTEKNRHFIRHCSIGSHRNSTCLWVTWFILMTLN